jgi:Arc/MetJ-type ribon-helix-helix transcriptional regulator
MPSAKQKSSAPLTFDLPELLVAKIARTRRKHHLATASEVVRLALNRFDLESFEPARDPHVQISVRITGEARTALRRAAKRKTASIGELIRAALEALPEKPARPVRRR